MGAQSESGSPAERAMLSIMAELAADGESIAIGDDQTCRGDDPACRGGVYVLRLADALAFDGSEAEARRW